MKVTTERLPESLVRLDIAAEAEESDLAVEKAFRKISRDIVIPGFRKGKVPRHMLERLVGREVWVEEANRSLMDDLYRKAIEQEKVVPVGDPEVELVAADPLEFKVTVPVYPSVDPGDYAAVRVEPIDAAIDESKIDEVIEALRLEQSPWVDPTEPRAPKDGDQVTVDIAITENGEEFQPPVEGTIFVLGESQLISELRTLIDGLQVGETGTTEISFPEEGEGAAKDHRRGKTLTYSVTLKELKERELLTLDDEFAKTYAQADSLEALQERIRTNLHAERTGNARTEAINQIVEKIAEGSTIEVPVAMVDDAAEEEVNRLRQRLSYSRIPMEAYLRQSNKTEEELREELRPNVIKRLRNSLILREIGEREGIAVDDGAIESEIETLISDMPGRDEAREVYRTSDYLRSTVRNGLFDRRLTDRLVELATEGRGPVVNGWIAPEPTEIIDAEPVAVEAGVETKDSIHEPDASTARIGLAATSEASTGWIEVEGAEDCPEGYPIKGNGDSMFYHSPESPSYELTITEICFATEEDAVAKGFRPTTAEA